MWPYVDVWCCQPFTFPREQILADINEFVGLASPSDDLTLVCFGPHGDAAAEPAPEGLFPRSGVGES